MLGEFGGLGEFEEVLLVTVALFVASWLIIVVLRDGGILADTYPARVFGDPDLLRRARIQPPQIVQLSNALDVQPVHLTVTSFLDQLISLQEEESV